MDLTPEVTQVTKEIEVSFKSLQTFRIADEFEFQNAALLLKDVKHRSTRLESLRKGMTQPLDAAKAAIMAHFAGPTDLLKKSEALIKSAMGDWNTAQQAKLEAERRRLAEDARKKEAALRAELAAKAAAAVEADDLDQAEYLMERAETAVVKPMEVSAAKVAGISTRTNWKFRITDFSKLPDDLKLPNEKQLGEIARTMKEGAKVAGVEFYSEESIVSR